MKRSPFLVNLSREHHGALSLARRARLAAEGGESAAVSAMAALVRRVFDGELIEHFREEEGGLLPALARVGESALVARTLAEHGELAGLAERLPEGGAAALLAFADALAGHVRFEERVLFPAAEGLGILPFPPSAPPAPHLQPGSPG